MASKGRHQSVHRCTCASCLSHPHSTVAKQHRAINRVLCGLDERNRRRFVGLLAVQWGRGGIQRLIEITGLSRNTIDRGRSEIQHPRRAVAVGRVRRAGGGRKRVEKNTQTF
jgi:hypothetical protein